MKALLCAGLALALSTGALGRAQDKAPPPPAPAGALEYRIGPGDVLEIAVFDNADLSRTPTVQTSGAIALPLLGEVRSWA